MLTDLPVRTIDYKKYGDLILSPREIVDYDQSEHEVTTDFTIYTLAVAIESWVKYQTKQVGSDLLVRTTGGYSEHGELTTLTCIISSTDAVVLAEMFGLAEPVSAVAVVYPIEEMHKASNGYVYYIGNTTNKFWFKLGAIV